MSTLLNLPEPGELELLSPEEIERRLEAYDHRFDLEAGAHGNEDDLAEMLAFFQHLIFVGEYRRAAELIQGMRPFLDEALEAAKDAAAGDSDGEASGPSDRLVEIAVSWNTLAMGFINFQPEEYAEYPFFEEMIELTDGRGGPLALRHWQARIGQLNNYVLWLERGGNPNQLPDEERRRLNEAYETLDAAIEQTLADWESREDYPYSLPLRRSYMRYAQQAKQSEAALHAARELAARLPQHPAFTDIDRADLKSEIAQVLAQAGQAEEALPLLEDAYRVYEAAGEEFEIFAAQTESWIEDLRGQV